MSNITGIRSAVLGRLPHPRHLDVDHRSRPLVFRLVPEDWTAVWEAVDNLRTTTLELEANDLQCPDRERADALVDACYQELRQLWEVHAKELTDADPRCSFERSAFVLAGEPTFIRERGRWINTDEGALIARYADSISAEEPSWLSRDDLCKLASRIEMESALR